MPKDSICSKAVTLIGNYRHLRRLGAGATSAYFRQNVQRVWFTYWLKGEGAK